MKNIITLGIILISISKVSAESHFPVSTKSISGETEITFSSNDKRPFIGTFIGSLPPAIEEFENRVKREKMESFGGGGAN